MKRSHDAVNVLMIPGADAIEESSLRLACLTIDSVVHELKKAQLILDQNQISLDLLKFMQEPNALTPEWFHHLAVATVPVQTALYQEYLLHHGKPDIVLSCSLGDVARNVSIGALQLEDAVLTMFKFIESVTQQKTGISCHLSTPEPFTDEQIKILQDQGAEIGVSQTPFHMMLGGSFKTIRDAVAVIDSKFQMKLKPLYPYPLHTSLMKPCLQAISSQIATAPIEQWSGPRLYSSVQRRWLSDAEELRDDMIQNIISTVHWKESLQNIFDQYPDAKYINLGPTPTLMYFHSRSLPKTSLASHFFEYLLQSQQYKSSFEALHVQA